MTDTRRLLEDAARAAGLTNPTYFVVAQQSGINRGPTQSLWNPLTDDGDALRLAVKLCLRVEPMASWCVAFRGSVCAEMFSERVIDDDRAAATRLAITRAAAAIGKQMREQSA